MKIIYRGGCNKLDPESVKNSTLYVYQKAIHNYIEKNKNVAIVTLAKPDGFYDEMIGELKLDKVEVINSKTNNADWSKYDLIIILGGKQRILHDQLVKRNFSLVNLKSKVILIGDSAGAYVLGASILIRESPTGPKMISGFYPKSNLIVIAHCNNPKYENEKYYPLLEKTAKDESLRLLRLNENEEKLLDESGKLSSTERIRKEMENS